jgi:hydroxymethylglutaryl-CoA reductase
MKITAVVGLAQNFAAVKSLTTTGIQQGHMKMHLSNILMSLQATEEELENAKEYFNGKVISFGAARDYLNNLRKKAVS